MRLLDLEIRNFRGVRALSLDLSARVIAIRAANGRGKSSILQALEWCLFGPAIEKKSSGIAARVAWEVAFRGASDAPSVTLRLDVSRDSKLAHVLHVTRTRAESTDGDHVALTEELHRVEAERTRPADDEQAPRQAGLFDSPPAPASPVRESRTERREYVGEDAERRLEELAFPDWAEWRRSFCQHQEDPRGRVVDGASRSAVLASLLGLDAWTELRTRVDALKARKAIQRLDAIDADLSRIAASAESSDATLELEEIHARLRARGVTVDADAATLRTRFRERLRDAAIAIGSDFELQAPPASDRADAAFAHWVRSFPREAVTAATKASKHGARLERRETIRAGLTMVTRTIDDARRARDAFLRLKGESGSDEELQAREKCAAEEERAAQERLRSLDARSALLREAQVYLRTRDIEDTDCPLCASPQQSELALRIGHELDAADGDARTTAQRDVDRSREALRSAAKKREELARLRAESEVRAAEQERALASLARILDCDPDQDVRAHGEKTLQDLEASILGSQQKLQELDADLESFRELAETWKELGALALTEARRSEEVDRNADLARAEYERAADRAARFAVDLEVLARFAREEQAKASELRLAEVQRSFGQYADAMLAHARRERGDEALRYRFVQKGTAQSIKYDVVDEHGKSALAIANQATLSAIALALLFARAEARARDGKPSFVLLDDPAQSLDREHARGLVDAIEALAAHCPVFVASPDGSLVDAIARLAKDTYRLHTLDAFDPAQGVRIQKTEDSER